MKNFCWSKNAIEIVEMLATEGEKICNSYIQ